MSKRSRREIKAINIADIRTNQFGHHVLKIFQKQCNELLGRFQEGDSSSDLVEIECRLGDYDYDLDRFVPGLSKQKFKVMLKYFVEKSKSENWFCADDKTIPVKMKYSDNTDVLFKSGVRVTCNMVHDSNNGTVKIQIIDMIKKKAIEEPETFFFADSKFKDPHHLRVGVSYEESVPKDSEDYDFYADAAKKVQLLLFFHMIKFNIPV